VVEMTGEPFEQKPVRLCLVRHGSTEWSESRRYTGHTDINLSELGRQQARDLAWLSDRLWAGIWSSDLSRCLQTAAIAGFEPVADARLREIDFGEVEGRSWEDLDPQTQEAIANFESFAPADGESVVQLRARLASFVGDLTSGNHLVFTHGGVIRAFALDAGMDLRPAPGSVFGIQIVGDSIHAWDVDNG
jgi:2,3-bisphosphoglycerate-dependent phosphoglycerate mutase